MIYRKYIKRLLDIICALAALIVFCWLYAIVAVLVRIKLGSPVLFKQARPGLNGKIFNLYKFRSMTDEKDENGNLLPDEVRLTKFGRHSMLMGWMFPTSSSFEIIDVWGNSITTDTATFYVTEDGDIEY